ncbi:uncharacterized small membrane protein [Opitutaceae bacterium TAV1]|nr:uncharacterized small membrane protein [Opitutaceae bacterium TAV1]
MPALRFVSALLGAAGVILGALGAHALHATLSARHSADSWETAVFYHLVHVVMILVVTTGTGSAPPAKESSERLRTSGPAGCWLTGILLFSGSIYVLALGGPRWLGPVTPLGGLFFIAGWLWAAAGMLREKRRA